MKDKCIFTVTLVGRGNNSAEAWENARENFWDDDPGYETVTLELPPDKEDCRDVKVRTWNEIRQIIQEVVTRHKKLKAIRLVKFEQNSETGVLSLLDIEEFKNLKAIHKKFPFGSEIDMYARDCAGTLMSIEPVPKDDY